MGLKKQPVESTSATAAFPRREPESGVRPAPLRGHGLAKLWEDDDCTEVSRTDLNAASTRTQARPRLSIMTGERAGDVIALDGKVEFLVGRSHSADIHLDEQGVSRAHCRIVRSNDGFGIQDLGSTNGTLVNGVRVGSVRIAAGDRIQIGPDTILQLGFFDDAEETLRRRLFEASTRDPLTGAFNRRHFDERLRAEVAYARRHRTGIAVILLDLDFFKSINDTAGHAAGDAVLQGVVRGLSRCIRTEDVVCRYGGEEFALIVRADSIDTAHAFAERVRAHIQSLRVPFAEQMLGVTVSAGVAELGECATGACVDDLVALADRRLYRAKSLGRNRVCAA